MSKVLAIIPARGGSKGLPRKNLRPLAGHPLIAYSVAAGLHFDDVWSEWGYNRFAGELLAIDEINTEYETRKIDSDRYNDHWHNGNKPWHVAMYQLQVFDHPDITRVLNSPNERRCRFYLITCVPDLSVL